MDNPYSPPKTQSLTTQEEISGEPATRMQRLLAAMVDGLLQTAIMFPVAYFSGMFDQIMDNASGKQPAPWSMYANLIVVGVLIFWLLHGYLLATQGQTIGKKLLKIRIVGLDDGKVSLGKLLFLRQLPMQVLSAIPLVNYLGLVDILFIFGRSRRCVHDRLAGTKVVPA
jgi:uncharacterized RDD family membrane protein YckC